MRKFGYVLFMMGIVVEVLILVITFASADPVSHVSLSYGIYMIIAGWQLMRHARGTAQQRENTVSNGQDYVSLAVHAEDFSRDMPVTSELSELLQKRMRRLQKVRLITMITAALFGAVSVVGISLAARAANALIIMPCAAGGGVLLSGIIGATMSFEGMRLRRDSRELTYLRSTGPVKLVKMKFGYILRLADRALFLNYGQSKLLRNLDWATIDYSRHAKLIFAVWDRGGNLIYRLDGAKVSI